MSHKISFINSVQNCVESVETNGNVVITLAKDQLPDLDEGAVIISVDRKAITFDQAAKMNADDVKESISVTPARQGGNLRKAA